jgi:hypothetical protein
MFPFGTTCKIPSGTGAIENFGTPSLLFGD